MRALNLTTLPSLAIGSAAGDSFYNTTNATDTWAYGTEGGTNSSVIYGSTAFTTYVNGNIANSLELGVVVNACPATGCSNVPATIVDDRAGILLWSDNTTWNNTALFPHGKPVDGDNVTIPNGKSPPLSPPSSPKSTSRRHLILLKPSLCILLV